MSPSSSAPFLCFPRSSLGRPPYLFLAAVPVLIDPLHRSFAPDGHVAPLWRHLPWIPRPSRSSGSSGWHPGHSSLLLHAPRERVPAILDHSSFPRVERRKAETGNPQSSGRVPWPCLSVSMSLPTFSFPQTLLVLQGLPPVPLLPWTPSSLTPALVFTKGGLCFCLGVPNGGQEAPCLITLYPTAPGGGLEQLCTHW